MTADVRRAPRRGTSSACATKHMHPERRERSRITWGRVLHSVRRPVHVNPHYTPRRKLRWWGGRESITVGQTWVTRDNQHWGFHGRTERGSPHVTASAREKAWHGEEKEGGRGLRPCEDQELGFGCPHVDRYVAEVGRRRLVSNRLGKRAPKRAVASSERGPSSGWRSVGETIGKYSGRSGVASRPHPWRRERTGARPRVARECHSAVRPSPKAVPSRGTGTVMVTGSYEGSLPMEGIPDHHDASAFTRRR